MEISGCHGCGGAGLRDRNSLNGATVAVSNRFIEFAPGRALVYLLESSFHAKAVTANLDAPAIRAMVPTYVRTSGPRAIGWAPRPCRKRVCRCQSKKDFQCMHKSSENDPDAYPHP